MRSLSLGPRTQAGLVLALVALLGALLGIIGDRLVAQQRSGDAPDVTAREPVMRRGTPRGPGMSRFADALTTRLDLSAAQRSAIESIIAEEQNRVRALNEEFHPRFRAIAQHTRARVDSVLTPAQREQLQTLRQQRMRRLDGPAMPRDTPMRGPARRP